MPREMDARGMRPIHLHRHERSVYPAAGFVVGARHAGAHTVELNLEPSDGATLFGEAFGPRPKLPNYVC
jgi:hypothetical protein